MKKITLSIALFGVISASNAAMVAPGVELVSSKTWITGNLINGHMENMDDNKVFFSYASAYASANGGTGKVMTNISSSGSHSFRVENTSSNPQTYTVSISLCADGSNCFNNSSSFRLSPGANYSSSAGSFITSYYSSAGCRSLVARTDVSGAPSATGTSSICVYN